CAFGAGFRSEKRDTARGRAEARRQETEARRAAEARAKAAAEELTTPLRLLGFSAGEARHAAAQCESIREAPLEDRMRFALSFLRPPHRVEKCLRTVP